MTHVLSTLYLQLKAFLLSFFRIVYAKSGDPVPEEVFSIFDIAIRTEEDVLCGSFDYIFFWVTFDSCDKVFEARALCVGKYPENLSKISEYRPNTEIQI